MHYNSGSFKASRRSSRITNLLFRDRESLDILARSNLRLKDYNRASKVYRYANRRGFSLLDHDIIISILRSALRNTSGHSRFFHR